VIEDPVCSYTIYVGSPLVCGVNGYLQDGSDNGDSRWTLELQKLEHDYFLCKASWSGFGAQNLIQEWQLQVSPNLEIVDFTARSRRRKEVEPLVGSNGIYAKLPSQAANFVALYAKLKPTTDDN